MFQNQFCRFNNEFRAKPLHRPPYVARTCGMPSFSKFSMHGNIRDRCKLVREPEAVLSGIAYGIIVGANDLVGLERLLLAIDDPENVFVIHVDKKLGAAGVADVTKLIPEAMLHRTRVISREKVVSYPLEQISFSSHSPTIRFL